MRQQLSSMITLTVALLSSCLITQSNAFTIAPGTCTTRTNQLNSSSRKNFCNNYETIIDHHYKANRGGATRSNRNKNNIIKLHLSSSSSSSSSKSTSTLPDVSNMKASELRKELQSYGISTKSFFEKSELVDAVEKARAEGKTPIGDSSSGSAESDTEASSSSSSSSSSASSSASGSAAARSEKLVQEMEKCNKMKVGELKKELESYGVSTKSFFEKSEFVRAVAEARVDGVKKSSTSSGGGRRTASSTSREEVYDPSYRDVQMQKMDPRSLGMSGMSSVIDVRLG